MKYRLLGRTSLKVSEIGFGAWAIGGPTKLGDVNIGWGRMDDNVSIRALQKCLDMGVNFIDTADVYGWGHSEELVGKAFKGKRDQVVIATKVGNRVDENGKWIKDFSGEWVVQAVEESLRRLQTDYIDIYQLHSPFPEFEYTEATFDVFEDLKVQGKIRFYGVSIGPVDHGLKVAQLDKGDVFQVIYSLLDRRAEELFPVAREKNIGIIARVPLASGFLTGKFTRDHVFPADDHRSSWPREKVGETVDIVEKLRFLEAGSKRTMVQAALQFCLAADAVSTVIPGAKTPEQLMANASASEVTPLTNEELVRIARIA